ncbi:ApbA-domain-containing protein [Neoconidiobolus thromboides FSU 785]|nr:ApbA-domain-containing protein [Neoconidiobolus thromboides FSU 785]
MVNIINVGCGAVGALYSSRLAKNEHVNMYVIVRSGYNVVQENGFQIKSKTFQDYQFKPAKVFPSIEEASKDGIVFDYVLITLKALPDQYDIPKMIEPLISNNTTIVVVQNGIDIEPPYKEKYPNNLLIGCVANVAVTQTEPGVIDEAGRSIISLSTFNTAKKSNPNELPNEPELLQLIKLFRDGDVEIQLVPDITIVRWNKIIWNGSFSPICILSGGCHTLNIHQDKEGEDLVRRSMQEIFDLAEAVIGGKFPDWVPEHTVEGYLSRSYGMAYKPSLLIDYERKNKLELEATLGNMVRKAKEINYPVPLSETYYILLKLADLKNRGII